MRMEQVVTNLLTNAMKFGAGKVVEVAVSPTPDGRAQLVVRDHGVGIAPADLERIFERFERARTTQKFPGLGLGLYIVRQIVEAHGGTIHAQSEIGAGATFTVDLPVEPPAASERASGAEAGDEPTVDGERTL
jgi:signal transduction histidine kinase